jgi:hypothetical protein
MGAMLTVTCYSSLLGSATIHATRDIFYMCSSTSSSRGVFYVGCAVSVLREAICSTICNTAYKLVQINTESRTNVIEEDFIVI